MSASDTGRATARFTIPETGESREFDYQFPMMDSETGSRTNTLSPIGAKDVTQHMGEKAEKMTARGQCYRDERDFLRTLAGYAKIEIRSAEFTGYAIVNNCRIEHTKEKGGKRPENTHTNKNYRYTLSLTETSAPPPDSQ